MRRRKVKGADEKLLSYKDYVVRDNIESLKGNWNQLFKNDNPIHAEFGTGRGKFLTTLAKQNPDINYIAFEIKEEVLLYLSYLNLIWNLFMASILYQIIIIKLSAIC